MPFVKIFQQNTLLSSFSRALTDTQDRLRVCFCDSFPPQHFRVFYHGVWALPRLEAAVAFLAGEGERSGGRVALTGPGDSGLRRAPGAPVAGASSNRLEAALGVAPVVRGRYRHPVPCVWLRGLSSPHPELLRL